MASIHEPFMRQALALADESAERGEVPVGALVVRNGEVLGQSHNLRETDQDPTAHGEILALRQAAQAIGSWRLEGCWVYVTLEPCPMCAGAMVLARIEGCVYGCSDPKGGFLGTLADLSSWPGLNHQFEVVPGVLAEESSERLKRFFKNLRKRG
ncbi:MAG: tRNA adenosine(34) deaminase TadA [Myxococcota bacterium]